MTKEIKPGWCISIELDTIREQLTDTFNDLGLSHSKLTCIEDMIAELEESHCAPYVQLAIERDRDTNQITRVVATIDRLTMDEDFHDNELLAVTDPSQIPDSYEGLVVETNDHGNQTLYRCVNQVLTEVWAVV